jgi:membrane glycosyltransferase
MGTGLFLLIFSIMVVVLDASNFLAIGLAFFVLMIGIMLVMIGAVSDLDKKKDVNQPIQATQTHTEIVREIVKVRCKYCNTLNLETSQRCGNCGAQL